MLLGEWRFPARPPSNSQCLSLPSIIGHPVLALHMLELLQYCVCLLVGLEDLVARGTL